MDRNLRIFGLPGDEKANVDDDSAQDSWTIRKKLRQNIPNVHLQCYLAQISQVLLYLTVFAAMGENFIGAGHEWVVIVIILATSWNSNNDTHKPSSFLIGSFNRFVPSIYVPKNVFFLLPNDLSQMNSDTNEDPKPIVLNRIWYYLICSRQWWSA